MENTNNTLKADWERWKQNMQNDIKSAFTIMAEENILCCEQCLATWETFLTSQTDLHLEEASEDKLQLH